MLTDRGRLRVLVAGGGGFIGRALGNYLVLQGTAVASADLSAVPGWVHGWTVDLLDADQIVGILRAWPPNVIFHVAGAIGLQDEAALLRAYLGTTEALLRAVRAACPAARVIILGSAAEYGIERPTGRIVEGATARPDSAYGRSKLLQSELTRQLAFQWKLDVVRVRLFNTLGPGQSLHLVAGAMVARLVRALRDGAGFLEVYDPESQRDYLDVRDVSRLLWLVARSVPCDPNRPPIHICSGEGVTVESLARTLVEIAGVSDRLPLSLVSRGAPTCIIGEPTTLRVLLGTENVRQISIRQSLQDMWKWHQKLSGERSDK